MSCLFYDYCGALCPCRPDVSTDPEIHEILHALRQTYLQTKSPWSPGFNPALCRKICERKDVIMRALYTAGLNRIRHGTVIEQLLDEAEEEIVSDEPPESLLREGLGNYLMACPWKRSEQVEQIIQDIVRVHNDCWTGSWPVSRESWHEAEASLPPKPHTKRENNVECKLGQLGDMDQQPEMLDIQRSLIVLAELTLDFNSSKFNPELCARICRNYDNIHNLISYKKPAASKGEDKIGLKLLKKNLVPILAREPSESLLRQSFEKYFGKGVNQENIKIVHLIWQLIKVHEDCLPDFCWRIPADCNATLREGGFAKVTSMPFCKDVLEKAEKIDQTLSSEEDVANRLRSYKETKALMDLAVTSLEEWYPTGPKSAGRELARKTQKRLRQAVCQIIVTRQHISKDNLDTIIEKIVSNLIPKGTSYEAQMDFLAYLQRAARRGTGKFGSIFPLLLNLHSKYCEQKKQEKRKVSFKGESTKKKARFEEITLE